MPNLVDRKWLTATRGLVACSIEALVILMELRALKVAGDPEVCSARLVTVMPETDEANIHKPSAVKVSLDVQRWKNKKRWMAEKSPPTWCTSNPHIVVLHFGTVPRSFSGDCVAVHYYSLYKSSYMCWSWPDWSACRQLKT